MEYSVKQIADISNQTPKTIRFYDKINLLKPDKIAENRYRIYTEKQLDILQQILFYRELGFDLNTIGKIIKDKDFDCEQALTTHIQNLKAKINRLEQIVMTAEKTLMNIKGKIVMNDKEKFEGFKRQIIDENQAKYGNELDSLYGKEKMKEYNERFMRMTEEQFNDLAHLEKAIIELLPECTDLPVSDKKCIMLYTLHKQWISLHWNFYDCESHKNLAEMYVEDKRFSEYYDKITPNGAKAIRDIIVANAK